MEYTPNSIQRRTYSKTFITLVFRVVLSGTYIQSTEYDFEYEFEKSFITTFPTAINLMVLEKKPKYIIGKLACLVEF